MPTTAADTHRQISADVREAYLELWERCRAEGRPVPRVPERLIRQEVGRMRAAEAMGSVAGRALEEGLLLAAESGFSGTIKDTKGREYRFVNGRRVKKGTQNIGTQAAKKARRLESPTPPVKDSIAHQHHARVQREKAAGAQELERRLQRGGRAAQERQARAGVVGRLVAAAGGVASGAKLAAKRLGGQAWSKLSPDAQRRAAAAFALGKAAYERAEVLRRKGKELALQAARERGLPEQHVDRVARVLAVAEFIGSATQWLPAHAAASAAGAGEVTAFTASKVASLVPLASCAYLVYSTARDPMATVRAARKVIAGQAPRHQEAVEADTLELLFEGIGRGGDWFECLLAAALDHTHDLGKAAELAAAALRRQPSSPALDAMAEELREHVEALLEEAQHAPKGGVRLGGKHFRGGEFIPGQYLKSKADRDKLAAAKKAAGGNDAPAAANNQAGRSTVPGYPKAPARNGRDPDASGLPARGTKAQNKGPWNPTEKAASIARVLKDVGGGKPGTWTQQNATAMEKVFAEALNFDHWGLNYPADIAGVVKVGGKPIRVGIDLKTAVSGTSGEIKKDDNAESLKIGFVTEEPDQPGFGGAASLSGNKGADVRSLMFFLAVNANHRVKEVPDVDPATGRVRKDAGGQPVMKKAGLLYLQAGVRGSNYKHMVPIEVEGLNDVSDLTKPAVLAKVRERILDEIKKTDPAQFAAGVRQSGDKLHARLVRERGRQDASLDAAGVELDATGQAQAVAGRALKAKERAQAKAREADKLLVQAAKASKEAAKVILATRPDLAKYIQGE